ncbi:CpsD/CapB family tyrosine-protein kinase [Geomobilimonas luticola]|uniref:CpsD/CapB family tyrosine-protein kinase n=1 Tax=Geomobilimonas luticola TaxID=1114878 RepID=A0ABS5SC29_9BACT|nr:CpsD/CapB family tyrosine-protein kinase [Geomobilimonas luticola]MBT0652916.1 CpsD/CapB family tyrosine-protein kinase [Geomobilimonas luticola]
MSNIFEALQLAEKERGDVQERQAVSVHEEKRFPSKTSVKEPVQADKYPLQNVGSSVEAEMVALYQNIDFVLPDLPQRAIQFISSHEGEGVSSVVREFARQASVIMGKSVLIVDAAHRNPSQHIFFNIPPDYGWKDAMKNGEPVENAVYKAGNHNLYLSPLVPHTTLSPHVYDFAATSKLLTDFKKKFDLILIDSSSATTSPDCIALTRSVDGVILVIEAEKTKWQVAEAVKDKIVKNGGNILGIVLNKRRFYIPDSIYKWL